MKKIFVFLIFGLFSLAVFAKISVKQIASKKDWDLVFEEAHSEDKFVLAFIGKDSCTICEEVLARLITVDSPSLENDFKIIRVNGEGDFGSEIVTLYELNAYPVGLFFDQNQTVLTSIVGDVGLKKYKKKIKAFSTYRIKEQLYKESFTKGELHANELLHYIEMLYEVEQYTLLDTIVDVYLEELNNDDLLQKENSFIILSLLTDLGSPKLKYLMSNDSLVIARYDEPFYDAFVKNVFEVNLDKAILSHDLHLIELLVENVLLVYLDKPSFEEGKSGTYQLFYLKTRQWLLYNKEILAFYNKTSNSDFLCEKALFVMNLFSKNKEMLSYAVNWLATADEQENNYTTKVLYASGLIQVEDYGLAFEEAKKAKKIAKTKEEKIAAEELIDLIKLKQETK